MKTYITIILLFLCTTNLFAAEFESDGLRYKILSEEDRTVGVSKCIEYGYQGYFEIPKKVINNSKTYTVISIERKAFYNRSGLTAVSIPNSVTTIGASAFEGCSGLTSVSIPSFVTTIGASAFEGCSGLTSVSIPSSVTTIGASAFYRCSSLEKIDVAENNTVYASIAGILYSKSLNTILLCPEGKKGKIEIPSSVTTIGDYAFYCCRGLTSVSIPSSVTTIGDYAFYCCRGLTSVSIPSSVTTIGDYAFYCCRGLTSVSIPSSVTTIGDYAFYCCRGLTSVSIPSSVTTIGDYAFCYCNQLKSVYCKMETPIKCGTLFGVDALQYAVLYVPKGRKSEYEKVDPWRNFWNIEEMDYSSGINDIVVDNDFSVSVWDGIIYIDGIADHVKVDVYDVSGKNVYSGNGSSIEGLNHGVYIVGIGNITKKIIL